MSNEARFSTLSVNEDTGDISLKLPEYADDDNISNISLFFLAVADKLVNDPAWVVEVIKSAVIEGAE